VNYCNPLIMQMNYKWCNSERVRLQSLCKRVCVILYPGRRVKLELICIGQTPLIKGLLSWIAEGPALESTEEKTFFGF